MPARRKSRKKAAPASASAASSSAAASRSRPKSPPLKPSSRKATPKPAARKRKEVSSLPRRTSPRIAALNRKKMIENGIVPPPLPPSEVAKHVVDDDAAFGGAQEHFGGLDGQDRVRGSNGSELLLTDGEDGDEPQPVDPAVHFSSGAAPPPPPLPAQRQYARRTAAATAVAPPWSPALSYEDEDDEEDGEDASNEEDAPMLEVTSKNIKEIEDHIENHAVILHFGNMHEITGMGISIGIANVKAWIYSNIGRGKGLIGDVGEVQSVRDMGRGFYGVFFEHAITCSTILRRKYFGGSIQVTAFKWCTPLNEVGRHCSPRMLVLPGLPVVYQRMLDDVGNKFGTFMGDIPDPAAENPRVAVMVPVDESIPRILKLKYKGDKPLLQVVLEQLPTQALRSVISRGKRKIEAIVASPSSSKQQQQQQRNKKKLKA